MRLWLSFVALSCIAVVPCLGGVMLCDCDSIDGWNAYSNSCELAVVQDQQQGDGAISVTNMPGQASAVVHKAYPPAEWDSYAGVSFWAKGDGSDEWGCLALAGTGSNGRYTYCYFFPLKSTEWVQYRVPWSGWVPEDAYGPIGTPGALPPSGIQTIRIGTRWTIAHNNAQIPDHSYAIDDIELEETLPAVTAPPKPGAFADVISLLREKRPVHIICMGDSITAGTGLANKDAERYAVLLQAELRSRLGYEDIFAESRAVGGAKLSDARAWIDRDFQGEAPDLVTTLYGYNDKSGMWSAAQFRASYEDYLSRIATVTRGKTALLPLTTIPGAGPRFTMLDDFAQAVREMCDENGLACCDMAQRLKSVGREGMLPLMGDMAHPNADGHKLMAATLAQFLAEKAAAE